MFIYSLNDNVISLDELLPLIGGFLMVFLLIIRLLLNLNTFANGSGESIPPIIPINSDKCNTFTYREWLFPKSTENSRRFFWFDLIILIGSLLVLLIGIYCTLGIFDYLPYKYYKKYVCYRVDSKKWKARVSGFVCLGLNPEKGSQRCNDNRCYLCIHDMVTRTQYIKSSSSDKPETIYNIEEIKSSTSCQTDGSVYLATCRAKGCNEKFIGSAFYGLNYYIQRDIHDDFRDINQAIKSKDKLKQAINELKIDNDLAALLNHYATHEDFNNDDIDFGKMFKFTFIGHSFYLDLIKINKIKDKWKKIINPKIDPLKIRCRVVCDYVASNVGEINIKEGDIIDFKCRVHKNGGWNYTISKIYYSELNQYLLGTVLVTTPSGIENGHHGTFPAKCVEVISNSGENVEPLPATLSSNAYICDSSYCYLCKNGMIKGHIFL